MMKQSFSTFHAEFTLKVPDIISSLARERIKQEQHIVAITFGYLAIYLARILPGSGRKRAFRSRRRVNERYTIDCLLYAVPVFVSTFFLLPIL